MLQLEDNKRRRKEVKQKKKWKLQHIGEVGIQVLHLIENQQS